MDNKLLWKSLQDGEVIGTGKEQIELLLHERNRLLRNIEYWSHCTSEGMQLTCPEKREELSAFLSSCRITPWFIPKAKQ